MKDKNRKKNSYLSHEMVFWCSTVNSEPIITDQQYRPLYRVALKFEISLLGPSHRAQYHAANDFADTRSALMDQPCSSCGTLPRTYYIPKYKGNLCNASKRCDGHTTPDMLL